MEFPKLVHCAARCRWKRRVTLEGVSAHCARTLGRFFMAWGSHVQNRRQQQQMYSTAITWWSRSLLLAALHSWCRQACVQSKVREFEERLQQGHTDHSQSWCFLTWVAVTSWQIRKKTLIRSSLTLEHLQQGLMRSVCGTAALRIGITNGASHEMHSFACVRELPGSSWISGVMKLINDVNGVGIAVPGCLRL